MRIKEYTLGMKVVGPSLPPPPTIDTLGLNGTLVEHHTISSTWWQAGHQAGCWENGNEWAGMAVGHMDNPITGIDIKTLVE